MLQESSKKLAKKPNSSNSNQISPKNNTSPRLISQISNSSRRLSQVSRQGDGEESKEILLIYDNIDKI